MIHVESDLLIALKEYFEFDPTECLYWQHDSLNDQLCQVWDYAIDHNMLEVDVSKDGNRRYGYLNSKGRAILKI